MKSHPIIFTAPGVRAIIDGRKTAEAAALAAAEARAVLREAGGIQ